jgi:ribosomal protein S18 acetylase RimI-like enzyme
MLLKALSLQAEQRGIAAFFLEVRAANAGARAFYEALGFVPCGLRKAYYADDNDNAILLSGRVHLSV